ncbi:MAG TPA: hypothetical protein VK602_10725, partial [Phyllobacterium sp.]|nr:hypothetical protein [Phyllobacterium sp.]
ASYARQSDDKTLENYAMRIRSRAIRRAGELLKEFDAPGKRTDLEPIDGGDKRLTQKQAGDDAGMSDRQRTTAVQVANVPAAEFEAAVESENPPTVTGLAETGKQSRPQKDAPPGFAQATQFIGTIDQLAQFCAANPPAVIANALLAHERASTQESVAAVVIWLGDFNLEFELGGNDARPADR